MTYWDKLKDLQPYSFMLNAYGGVVRVANSSGGWLERHEVQELIDSADTDLAAAQQEIARLRAALETYEAATAELQASHLAGTPFDWTLWNIAHMQARQALK